MKKGVNLLFLLWIALLLLLLYPQMRSNWGFVLANKGLGLEINGPARYDYWYRATKICLNSDDEAISKFQDHQVVIRQFDDCYIQRTAPLLIITDTVSVPASTFALGGLSRANQLSGKIAFLYGNGYLEALIIPLEQEEVTLSVRALHHELPPVILEVWIDEKQVGELSFDKGDGSWGTLSLPITLNTNFHRLRISYTNDSYDKALEIDRNAFIQNIKISQ